jgi:hypothetical protein
MGIIFCLVSITACYVLGRWSLAAGLGAVLSVGYLYGVVRANFLDGATYFVFDCAVLGLYLARLGSVLGGTASESLQALQPLRRWTWALLGWTAIMSLLPLQHVLIQLVGLRGNAFLLPFLLLGGALRRLEARQLSLWVAALNHVACAFALAEFFMGVPALYPRNQVTELIYRSGDVAGGAFRIPACFANAHSYGGTMVTTLPWLIGAWVQPRVPWWQRLLLASGIAAAMAGAFMSAARTIMAQLVAVLLVTTLSGKLRGGLWLGWIILLGGIAHIVSGEERLQRFTTLQDTEFVTTRLQGSVNLDFLELLRQYPLGNGMGAGGTSIPYFLQHLLSERIGLENEYCRIMLEQGIPGLVLWLAFVVWCAAHPPTERRDPWYLGKRLLWVLGLLGFGLALTGTGLMTAIPQSPMFFLGLGFALTRHPLPRVRPEQRFLGRRRLSPGHPRAGQAPAMAQPVVVAASSDERGRS